MTTNYKAIKGDVNFIEETHSLQGGGCIIYETLLHGLPGGL